MRPILTATCLTILLLGGWANAADPAQNEKAAKGKAEVLEEKASALGSKALPTSAAHHQAPSTVGRSDR